MLGGASGGCVKFGARRVVRAEERVDGAEEDDDCQQHAPGHDERVRPMALASGSN